MVDNDCVKVFEVHVADSTLRSRQAGRQLCCSWRCSARWCLCVCVDTHLDLLNTGEDLLNTSAVQEASGCFMDVCMTLQARLKTKFELSMCCLAGHQHGSP